MRPTALCSPGRGRASRAEARRADAPLRRLRRLLLLLALPFAGTLAGLCGTGSAQADGLTLQQRHVLLGYRTGRAAAEAAPFNTGNGYAALAGRVDTAEWRADLSLHGLPACQAALALRARVTREGDPAPGRTADSAQDLYARTGGLVCGLGEAWDLRAGRFVLAWGNATFRSPSNPFFWDTGKTDPVRETVGRDMVALGWRSADGWALSILAVGPPNRRTTLGGPEVPAVALRVEHTGAAHSAGLVLSRHEGRPAQLGAYLTWTASQALIIYGEGAWRRGSNGLYPVPATDTALGWRYDSLPGDGRRRATVLAGAAYTLASGWTLTGEALLDEDGYSDAQRVWARSAAEVADAALQATPGPATQQAGALIAAALQPGLQSQGRHQLFVQLQRSEWGSRADFALRWAWDADHRASTWSASLTYFLTPRTELLALGLVNGDSAVDARVLRRSLLLGLRLAL